MLPLFIATASVNSYKLQGVLRSVKKKQTSVNRLLIKVVLDEIQYLCLRDEVCSQIFVYNKFFIY